MTPNRLRDLLHSLPHVAETMQWGETLVFWVGDKAIGGKMFALVALDSVQDRGGSTPAQFGPPDPRGGNRPAVVSFSAGPERSRTLLEIEGVIPAPYLARVHWVAATGYEVFSAVEWSEHLRHAYDLTVAKLAPRTRAVLDLPAAEQRRLIAARRKTLADARLARDRKKP